MKPKKRQKLCHNCEGEIDVDVIVCPFCATDLREEKPEQQVLHKPSLSIKQASHFAKQDLEVEEKSPNEDLQEPKHVIGPTILVALGAQLFLFGCFMLLFSKQGIFVLKWDESKKKRLWRMPLSCIR